MRQGFSVGGREQESEPGNDAGTGLASWYCTGQDAAQTELDYAIAKGSSPMADSVAAIVMAHSARRTQSSGEWT